MVQDGVKALLEKGYKKITPFFIPYAITNMGEGAGGGRGYLGASKSTSGIKCRGGIGASAGAGCRGVLLRACCGCKLAHARTPAGGALVGIDQGFMGPNYSISTACATANYCFVSAANHIR